MLLTDYFPQAQNMANQLKQYGEKYDLPFNDITMIPNTNKALQVGEYAKTVGKGHEFSKAMYKAVFVDDINISLEEEIIRIAESVGLKNVSNVWQTSTFESILEENKVFCHQHNISSVPTFIINDTYAIVGAQGPEAFKKVFHSIKS